MKKSQIAGFTALVFGAVGLAMVFVSPMAGGIFSLAAGISGLTAGTMKHDD